MDNETLLKFIYAKYNELESLKTHIKDDASRQIIEAKQDTLSDMEDLLKGGVIKHALKT